MAPLKTVLVRVTEEEHEFIRLKAFQDRTSISNLVRMLIQEEIKKEEDKSKP